MFRRQLSAFLALACLAALALPVAAQASSQPRIYEVYQLGYTGRAHTLWASTTGSVTSAWMCVNNACAWGLHQGDQWEYPHVYYFPGGQIIKWQVWLYNGPAGRYGSAHAAGTATG